MLVITSKVLNIFIVISLLTLFTGCLGVDINHKINLDETSDISITVSSDYPIILNAAKENLTKNLGSDWIYSETEKSFTLSRKNVVMNASAPYNGILSQAQLKKEFKFPYYFYTYSFVEKKNLPSSTDEEYERLKGLISIDYHLEVFGIISETNGLKTTENSVLFKLEPYPKQDKRHYVIFKEFFLRVWFKI